MKNLPGVRVLSGLTFAAFVVASTAEAQQKQAPITGDLLVRQEWNSHFFTKPDVTAANRTRFQLRPRFEIETQLLRMGVGVDVNYSRDNNLEPKDIALPLALIRDNYDSRSIRLDLAYLGLSVSSAIKVTGGRMIMPFRTTDMIWDKDLRIQGGVGEWIVHQGATGEPTARVSALYSRGSHVFGDSEKVDGSSLGTGVTVKGASLDLGLGSGKRVDLSSTYMKFDKLENLERKIRRQNTRISGGPPVREYEVVDIVLRLRTDAPFPIQVVVDGARNRKAPDQKNGIWASLVLGSLTSSRLRGEYTYAKVDRDVTVAAYAGDDFFWGTGWLGHRVDLGVAQSAKNSVHVIGQLQQFKDSANLAERPNWVRRLRVEARRVF